LYSQKPVGLTVEQVNNQIKAAKDAGVVFAASPIHPLRPDIMEVKKMIEDGCDR
jgi:predicted dehydrogenase